MRDSAAEAPRERWRRRLWVDPYSRVLIVAVAGIALAEVAIALAGRLVLNGEFLIDLAPSDGAVSTLFSAQTTVLALGLPFILFAVEQASSPRIELIPFGSLIYRRAYLSIILVFGAAASLVGGAGLTFARSDAATWISLANFSAFVLLLVHAFVQVSRLSFDGAERDAAGIRLMQAEMASQHIEGLYWIEMGKRLRAAVNGTPGVELGGAYRFLDPPPGWSAVYPERAGYLLDVRMDRVSAAAIQLPGDDDTTTAGEDLEFWNQPRKAFEDNVSVVLVADIGDLCTVGRPVALVRDTATGANTNLLLRALRIKSGKEVRL